MSLSDLEFEVLGLLLDDLEAPQSIDGNISAALARPVTQAEVRLALDRLASTGLAHAYEYDLASASYQLVPPDSVASRRNVWFKASAAGRALVEDVA